MSGKTLALTTNILYVEHLIVTDCNNQFGVITRISSFPPYQGRKHGSSIEVDDRAGLQGPEWLT